MSINKREYCKKESDQYKFVDSPLSCIGNINASAFIELKFDVESITGLVSSFRTVVEPGNKSIVLIGFKRC